MNKERIIQEIDFKAVRSSGPGGQNVNKVSTKVLLTFDVANSEGLSDVEKNRIFQKLSSKLTKEGVLLLQCAETRSQHKNKSLVLERLFEVLKKALTPVKPRKKTRPSKNAIEKRLKNKKMAAQKKAGRSKPNPD